MEDKNTNTTHKVRVRNKEIIDLGENSFLKTAVRGSGKRLRLLGSWS